MKKNKKIIIATVIIALVIIVGVVAAVLIPKLNFSSELKDEEFTKQLENVSEFYVRNDVAITDENGITRNYSEQLSLEKMINENVGMYDIKIVNNDNDESVLTFTIKNHSNETINPIEYRLQFLNEDGSIIGTIDLETQKLKSLEKYNVKINLDRDILDTYDIVPVTEFEIHGNIGGDYLEA